MKAELAFAKGEISALQNLLNDALGQIDNFKADYQKDLENLKTKNESTN